MNEDPKVPAPPVLSDPDGGNVPPANRQRPTDSRVSEGGVGGHGGPGQERDLGGVQGTGESEPVPDSYTCPLCLSDTRLYPHTHTIEFSNPKSVAVILTDSGPVTFLDPKTVAITIRSNRR